MTDQWAEIYRSLGDHYQLDHEFEWGELGAKRQQEFRDEVMRMYNKLNDQQIAEMPYAERQPEPWLMFPHASPWSVDDDPCVPVVSLVSQWSKKYRGE